MEERQEFRDSESNRPSASPGANRWMAAVIAALLVVAGLGFAYGYRQQAMVGQLSAHEMEMKATMSQLQGQLDALITKQNQQNQMAEAQNSANASPSPGVQPAAATEKPSSTAAPGSHPAAKRSTGKRRPVTDKRYQQLQAQLAEQQKQLKETQGEVAKNRADLEGTISSTRDELNGSIAKTHDELVVLQRRGERNYVEFDLTKSKQFQRIGPITLSLRKADTKHKNYDLAMIVDDNQLNKKKVNLYEPIWIHTENESQPIQIVVNRVDRNLVHGYVSAPKYKPSELAGAATPGLMPVSAHSPSAEQKPADAAPTSPQQP